MLILTRIDSRWVYTRLCRGGPKLEVLIQVPHKRAGYGAKGLQLSIGQRSPQPAEGVHV